MSEKIGLKLNFQKTKIMASGPITSWEIDGETVKTVSDFILGGSKITADGDCIHEIKRRLLRGRKVMTNLDGIVMSLLFTMLSRLVITFLPRSKLESRLLGEISINSDMQMTPPSWQKVKRKAS